jgi:RimJ/RimL family protein N-acetyltransferase
VRLIPVDPHNATHLKVLWELLEQRPAENNISHREMPTMAQHCRFVANAPYEFWGLIDVDHHIIGAIYLSKPGGPSVLGNEIGIDIFRVHQGKGYGAQAVKLLMEMHGPRRYVANTAPGNEASQALFKSLGFKLCQYTYALEAA